MVLCAVCETPAPLQCSGCHEVRYCTKEHQKDNWKSSHKSLCPSLRTLKAGVGFAKETLSEGSGVSPQPGQKCVMHYTGMLPSGKVFDSSVQKKRPFTFTLGCGEVISGWDEGVAVMVVGEKARLTISAEYGYGAEGVPNAIPPNSPLIFDVELLEVIE